MKVREFIRRLGDFRQLTRELASYSDAELADLGIARPDILRIAIRGAFAKARSPTASVDASVNRLTEPKSACPTCRYADRGCPSGQLDWPDDESAPLSIARAAHVGLPCR